MNTKTNITEYVIIGAGPAAICTIPNLLNSGVVKENIVWIDPQFKVGEFGTNLSVGSSVPGNTTVASYQRVNQAIYQMIPACAPTNKQLFEIDNLDPSVVCSLKTASMPLQHITHELRKIVNSIEGTVSNIITTDGGLNLEIKLTNGQVKRLATKRVILASGALPRALKLSPAHSNVTMINPTIAFVKTELANYLQQNPHITTVAVIGSSHSAALATMHLLLAGITVKQFMNKEYKYAEPAVATNGVKFILHDNTGLKGDVAKFTKQLLIDLQAGNSKYHGKIIFYIGKDQTETDCLLEKNLWGCSHAVAAIGYIVCNSLRINNLPLNSFAYNSETTEFKNIKGLFGIGIAFPQKVVSPSGEIEFAVGVEKFWTTASNLKILDIWHRNFSTVESQSPRCGALTDLWVFDKLKSIDSHSCNL